MFCNNYCPEVEHQPGSQPIRVFAQYFSNIFINIYNEIVSEYPHCREVTCSFNTDDVKAESPFVIFSRITIPYSFLSFLWCSAYHFINSIPHDGVGIHYQSIIALRKYSVSMLHDFTEWNKNELPNPEYYQRDIHENVGKANFVFIIAVNYVFYHEFAHVALKHQASESSERSKEMENEADMFAISRIENLINSGGTTDDDESKIFERLGLLTAFASLTMTSPSMKGFDHPDPDSRLLKCIEFLSIDEEDGLWMVAGWYLLQWQMEYRRDMLDIPSTEGTKKEEFMKIYRNFQKWKSGFPVGRSL